MHITLIDDEEGGDVRFLLVAGEVFQRLLALFFGKGKIPTDAGTTEELREELGR